MWSAERLAGAAQLLNAGKNAREVGELLGSAPSVIRFLQGKGKLPKTNKEARSKGKASQVETLILSGLSYRAIAVKTGFSETSIRDLANAGLISKRQPTERLCAICGSLFLSPVSHQRYCSERCVKRNARIQTRRWEKTTAAGKRNRNQRIARHRARNRKPALHSEQCLVCEIEFLTNRSRKTCSDECAYMARKSERRRYYRTYVDRNPSRIRDRMREKYRSDPRERQRQLDKRARMWRDNPGREREKNWLWTIKKTFGKPFDELPTQLQEMLLERLTLRRDLSNHVNRCAVCGAEISRSNTLCRGRECAVEYGRRLYRQRQESAL